MAAIVPRNSFIIGETATWRRTVSEADIVEFARISGDSNPVHLDDAYARTTRFGGRIAHGMLAAAFISATLGNQLPGPGAVYLSQTLKFTAPVRAGDIIATTVEVLAYREDKRIVTMKTECANQHGEVVVTGEAVLLMEKAP